MTTLLSMSASAAILIAVIIVVRSLFIHRLPKRLFVILWTVAALRMLVPFAFPINITNHTTQPENADVPALTAAETENPETSGADPELVIEIIWAAGALTAAGVMAALHIRSRRELSTALPLSDPNINSRISAEKLRRKVTVKVSDRVTSPLTYGVISPVIILPKNLPADSEEVQFVLAHELVHIRRADVLLKTILSAAVCVHWFDPLAWAMLSLANRDIELSCDEEVLKQLGCKREDYAMALIRLEEKRSVHAGAAFGRSAVRERIEAIMKYKKTTVVGMIVSACLIAGTTTAFAAVSSDDHTQEAETVYFTTTEFTDEATDEVIFTNQSTSTTSDGEQDGTYHTVTDDDEIVYYISEQDSATPSTDASEETDLYFTLPVTENPPKDGTYQTITDDDGTVYYIAEEDATTTSTNGSEETDQYFTLTETDNITCQDGTVYYDGEPVMFYLF